MADTKKSEIDESKAEKHVIEIMGPAEPLDGSKPVPPVMIEPVEKPAEKDVEIEKSEAETPEKVETIASAPEVDDIEQAAAETAAEKQAKLDATNGDLDMAELPEDFNESSTPDEAETAAAVADIMHSDADAALPDTPAAEAVVMKPSLAERFKNAWYNWWDSPWKRYSTLGSVAVLALLVIFVGPIRTFALNTVGIRSSAIVTVFDGATNLPLQNAVLRVDGKETKTDDVGKAKIKGIKLGKRSVEISKLAFATNKKQVNFGMRIVDLGDVTLKAVGTQLSYQFTDYLSGKNVADVELKSGEATAKSDKKGKAVITVQPSDVKYLSIEVKKTGYRTEKLTPSANSSKLNMQKMVPAAHAIFISKESGKYDVYKMYIDGKDRQVLLAGTGLENQSIVALPSSDGNRVAVASTRDEKRNKDGFLLTALNIVDVASGEQTNIEHAERITLLGWRGSTLVYSQTVAGTSAGNPNREKIIAYDLDANKRLQLASANYFPGYELIADTLYYTVASYDQSAQETFARVQVDGSAKKTIYTGDVWSLQRASYDTMKLQTPTKWLDYKLGNVSTTESTPAAQYVSRYYVDNPSGKTSAWVDVRDTKGVLITRTVSDGKEKELTTQKNMQIPAYWLSETVIVYKVNGASEVADYAVSIDGGAAKKIADVSLTGVR